MKLDEIDLIEINEAFAGQILAVIKELASTLKNSTSTAARSRWAIRWPLREHVSC